MTDLKNGIAILFKSLMCRLDLSCDISDILKHIHLKIHKRNIRSCKGTNEPRHDIFSTMWNVRQAKPQSDQSLCLSLEYSMSY